MHLFKGDECNLSVFYVPNFVWGWIEAYHSLNLLNSLIFHPTAHTVTVFFCHVDPMRRLKDMQRCLNTDGHLFSVKTWNSLLFQLFEWRGKEQKIQRNMLRLTPSVRATLVRNEEIFSSCVARLQEDIMSFPGNSVMELSFPSRRRRWRESRIYLDFNS